MSINTRYGKGSSGSITFAQLMSDPERGLWQKRRRVHQARPERVWRIVLAPATGEEVVAILSEWESACGPAGDVTFRPPGASSDITARFEDNSLRIRRITQTHYSFSFNIIQDKYI